METRVFIADDHALVREGCRQVMNSRRGIHIVGEAISGKATLDMLRANKNVDVLVLDLGLPDIHGLEVLKILKKCNPSLRIVILTMHNHSQFVKRAFQLGANGYLSKDSVAHELLQAIRSVMKGFPYVSKVLARDIKKQEEESQPKKLSTRENQVLLSFGQGKTVTEIANEFKLSVKTVSTYRRRILDKLSLNSDWDLINYVFINEFAR